MSRAAVHKSTRNALRIGKRLGATIFGRYRNPCVEPGALIVGGICMELEAKRKAATEVGTQTAEGHFVIRENIKAAGSNSSLGNRENK